MLSNNLQQQVDSLTEHEAYAANLLTKAIAAAVASKDTEAAELLRKYAQAQESYQALCLRLS